MTLNSRAEIHHLRLGGRRQKHADRPPAGGQQGRAAGPPGRRAAPGRDRPGAADRRPVGRARTGHHHRRGLPLLQHRRPQIHHRRRARPRAVHPQHGDRRLQRRCRRGAGRCHQAGLAKPRPGTAAANPPPLAAGQPAARAVHRVRRQQARRVDDAARWLLPTSARALHAFAKRAGIAVTAIVPVSALKGWNVVDAAPSRLVRLQRPDAAADSGAAARHRGRHRRCLCLPGAVGRKILVSARHLARAAACSGAVWPPAACSRASRSRVCPAARPPRWPRCWTTRASPAAVLGRPQRRHRAGPRSGCVARRLAAGRRQPFDSPAARFRPPWPGWTTSRWSPAASTGRCTATAGSRPRSSASCTSSTSTPWPKKTPPSSTPNAIGHIELALQEPIAALPYSQSRVLGSLVLVDTAIATKPRARC